MWKWRNCRSLAVGFRFWIWPWGFGTHRDDDEYGGQMNLYVGPIDLSITYSIGNASADHWWERAGALHDNEIKE